MPCAEAFVFFPRHGPYRVGHIYAVIVLDDGAARGHSIALGYVCGGQIVVADYRKQFLRAHNPESVFHTSRGGFRRVSVPPETSVEHIAYFGDGPAFQRLNRYAALSDEHARVFQHDSPKPAAVLFVAAELPLQPICRLLVRKAVFVRIHGFGVAKAEFEKRKVCARKQAKNKTFCRQHRVVFHIPIIAP